jgi:hypothetical protein
MTAWIITKDKIESDAKGVTGPRTASEADIKRLQAGEGKRFRMLDDDGEIYYYGRQLETSDADKGYYAENEFAPLDNFGTPNAGCTEIQFDNGAKDSKGKVVWESL